MEHRINKTTVFRRGSKNFFFASMFFSAKVRKDITTLYSFVRVVDDFVDQIPQNIEAMHDFYAQYRALYQGHTYRSDQYTVIIQDMLRMMQKYTIDPQWIESFFVSMKMDTVPTSYELEKTLMTYIYGSAEIVGLCIVSICALPRSSYQSAQMIGRAFQYINFIRDIKEDFQLGRIYLIPQSIPLNEYRNILQHGRTTEAFDRFIRQLIDRYNEWCNASLQALSYFTFSAHFAIMIAVLIFNTIAQKIYDKPSLVLKKKTTVVLFRKVILVIRALVSVVHQRLVTPHNNNPT